MKNMQLGRWFRLFSFGFIMIFLSNCSSFERYEPIEVLNSDAKKLTLYGFIIEGDTSFPGAGGVRMVRTTSINKLTTWNFNFRDTISFDRISGLDLNIGQSLPLLLFDTVPGVNVRLFRNDTLITTLRKDTLAVLPKGWFDLPQSVFPVQQNARYKFIASAPGFPDVESTQVAPSTVRPTSVQLTNIVETVRSGSRFREIWITIPDPPNEENVYQVGLRKERRRDSAEVIVPFTNRDPNAVDEFTLADTYFNGQNYIWKVAYEVRPDDSTNYSNIVVYLNTVGKDYAKFSVANKQLNSSVGNPFVEPFNPYTNIKNGFGLFIIVGQFQAYKLPIR